MDQPSYFIYLQFSNIIILCLDYEPKVIVLSYECYYYKSDWEVANKYLVSLSMKALQYKWSCRMIITRILISKWNVLLIVIV